MARFAVAGKYTAGVPQSLGVMQDPMNASSTAADKTTVAANVATLVADGASPTQAHVTTLNTNWALLSADIASGSLGGSADVVISFDASVVTSITILRQMVQALLLTVQSGVGGLTP